MSPNTSMAPTLLWTLRQSFLECCGEFQRWRPWSPQLFGAWLRAAEREAGLPASAQPLFQAGHLSVNPPSHVAVIKRELQFLGAVVGGPTMKLSEWCSPIMNPRKGFESQGIIAAMPQAKHPCRYRDGWSAARCSRWESSCPSLFDVALGSSKVLLLTLDL